MRDVLLLLATSPLLSLALQPGDTFPSCLQANSTWDQRYVSDIIQNVLTPEACQSICSEKTTCAGVTWTTGDSDIIPFSCLLFSELKSTAPCSDCVSGPPVCSCPSIPGECRTTDDNVIDIFPGVTTEAECYGLCSDTQDCTTYTYLGENNDFSHVCFLFSSCANFSEDCSDCMSGIIDCQICNFFSTATDGTCSQFPCKNQFGDFCYLILDNGGERYTDIDVCREDCQAQGGSLGSIHSEAENDFVYSLLRPINQKYNEQSTLLGARRNGDFEWEDGSAWNYNNWTPRGGEPDAGDVFAVMGFEEDYKEWWGCNFAEVPSDCLCKRRI